MFSVKSVSFVALALLFVSGVSAAPAPVQKDVVARALPVYEDLEVMRRGYENDDAVVVAREAAPEPVVASIKYDTSSRWASAIAAIHRREVVAVAERKAEPEAEAEPFNRSSPKIPVGVAIHKRDVPVEQAAKNDGSGITFYKRDVAVEVASVNDGSGIRPYKRDVPVEQAAKNDGSGITFYKRDVPVEQAAKNDGSGIAFYKRDDENVKVAKRNVLKLSSAGPARRSSRYYKRSKSSQQ